MLGENFLRIPSALVQLRQYLILVQIGMPRAQELQRGQLGNAEHPPRPIRRVVQATEDFHDREVRSIWNGRRFRLDYPDKH